MDQSVVERYTEGALARQADLCCPVDYDAGLLKLLPREIVERDYGCGDPSRYVRSGDTVLDLGSGGGKICYMAAQLVGADGQVIGVDMNDAMLALARRHQADMARKLGGDRVRFLKGHIQDLALDVEAMDAWLAEHPVRSSADLPALRNWQDGQRRERPLIADASVDLVISNCVLNLVHAEDRGLLVREIFRVVRPGGRVAISDIVSDQRVPERLRRDPELWSGCISGAFEEREFLEAFAAAGFIGVRYDKWEATPWRVVEGIEFRSVTLTASKPAAADTKDLRAVIYRGPYAEVRTDDGKTFRRGARTEVDAATAIDCASGPYASDFISTDAGAAPEGCACKPGCC